MHQHFLMKWHRVTLVSFCNQQKPFSKATLLLCVLTLKNPVSINSNLSLFFSNQNITFGVWLHLLKGNSLNIQRRVLSRVSMIWIAVSVADLWKEVTESNSRSKLFGLWRQQLINHSHCFPSDTAEYRVLRNDGDITTLCLCWVMERGDTSFLCNWMTSGELRSTAIK